MPTRLYHFTAPEAMRRIRREGLTAGLVVVPPPFAPPSYRLGDYLPPLPGQPPSAFAAYAYTGQWLTDDPDWRQAWATRDAIDADRTAWRVTVAVPADAERLTSWYGFATRYRLDQRWPLWLADFEGRTLGDRRGAYGRAPDPARWWVYLGHVPARWLSDWRQRPANIGAPRTDRAVLTEA